MTHPKMEVFFSSIDVNNINRLHKQIPVVVAGVFNEKGESYWAIVQRNIWTEFYVQIKGSAPSKEEKEAVKPLLERYVTEKKSHFFGKGIKSSALCWERKNGTWCLLKAEHKGECVFPTSHYKEHHKAHRDTDFEFGGYV